MIQLQNLPQNHMPDLEQARGLVESGNYTALELLYDDIPDTLSQLIRTAFVPRTDMKFVVADFLPSSKGAFVSCKGKLAK